MTSTITGDKELLAKLRKLQDLSFLRPSVEGGAEDILRGLKVYPAKGPANMAINRRWYQRKWGSKWRRADGSIGGIPSSEKLQQSWARKTESDTRAIVGTDTSYAQTVMGPEQAAIFAAIGWNTTDDIVDERSENTLKTIQNAVDRELAKG